MTRDIHVLIWWIRVCLIIAGLGTTAVPALYAFSPWRARRFGQIFMLQAICFAAAVDLTVLFTYWTPRDILVQFLIETVVFTAIAISSSALAVIMWRMNHPKKKGNTLTEATPLLTNRFYDFLKFLAQILLPALATLYFALAGIWHLPSAEQVVGTITSVDAFLGLLLSVSTKTYVNSGAKYAGMLEVHNGEDGSELHLKSVNPVALTTQQDVTFKVNRVEKPTLP